MLNKLILGNEKAVLGGFGAGLLAFLAQVGNTQKLTWKEVVYSVITWVATHGVVYIAVNSDKSLAAQVGQLAQRAEKDAADVSATIQNTTLPGA